MRLIEKQMNAAICNCEDWKSANTEVCVMNDGTSYVFLHGNKIAEIGDDYVELSTRGYYTNTTKSRLNAILEVHGNGARIYQKDYEWFVSDNGQTIPFTEGMILK